MKLKLFKLLTVISFVFITLDSGHIGGQFGLFIVLGFLSDYKDIIISFLTTLILIIFIVNSFKSFKPKIEYLIFLIGGIVLLVPIIMHINFLFSKNRNDDSFYITTLLYLFFYGTTLYFIIKRK